MTVFDPGVARAGRAASRPQRMTPPRVTPPAEPLPLLQGALVAQRNLLETIPAAAYERDVVEGGTRGAPWKMVQAPEAVARVLKRADLYARSETASEVLRSREGENLFTVEGAEHRWRRRAVAPAFRRGAVEALAPAMSRAAEVACARIAARRGPGRGHEPGHGPRHAST
jgi:Cytochrome P450